MSKEFYRRKILNLPIYTPTSEINEKWDEYLKIKKLGSYEKRKERQKRYMREYVCKNRAINKIENLIEKYKIDKSEIIY